MGADILAQPHPNFLKLPIVSLDDLKGGVRFKIV